ncbi:MAG TPA: hypothetical protein VEF04_12475 [Blastocatellia bacterium]|nr:hypothetical protein [Blastocatellia bacterium]
MFESFFTGLAQASRQWKMILVLWVTNILLAVPILVPIFLLVLQTAGGTRAAQRMFANKLDVIWVIDLFNERFEGFSLASVGLQIGLLLLAMGGIYLLANMFFAGGILNVLKAEDQQFTMRRFWEGCGAYFGRFFRLWLISLFFYSAALVIYRLIMIFVNEANARASAAGPGIIKRWIALAVLLGLFAFVNMIIDYAKIITVVRDSKQIILSFIQAAKFSLRRLPQAFGLYLLFALVGTGIFLVFTWIRSLIPQASYVALFAATLLGQLATASRMWMRVAFYAGETNFYQLYALQQTATVIEMPMRQVPKPSAEIADGAISGEETLAKQPVSNSPEVVSATPVLYDLEAEIEAMRRADLEAAQTAREPEQKTSGHE